MAKNPGAKIQIIMIFFVQIFGDKVRAPRCLRILSSKVQRLKVKQQISAPQNTHRHTGSAVVD